MDKFNIAVLVDAKQEYTHQLVQLLYPQIYVGIKSIYDAAKQFCEESNDANILKKFQILLSNVPKWNMDRIQDEFKRIQRNTECDWIEDLITAVFVSHTKVLTAIQLKSNNKKTIQLNVPEGPFFVHKCYTEVARGFWKRPYLLNHKLSNIDMQRNLADSEELIKSGIQETVRRMLPVRHILKEYLGTDYKDDELNDEDITSNISLNTKNNLRKLVQQEIEQTLSKKDESIIDSQSVRHVEIKDIKPEENEVKETVIRKLDYDNTDATLKVDEDNKVEATLEENITETVTETVTEPIIEKTVEPNILVEDDKLEKDLIEAIQSNNQKAGSNEIVDEVAEAISEVSETDNKKNNGLNHLADIFKITPQEILDNKESEEKEKAMDIFSFFEDAAPFKRS
jgi:hypothetical protein